MNDPKIRLSTALPKMPKAYADNVTSVLSSLPEKSGRKTKARLPKKTISLLVAAATLLLAGAALAAGILLKMQGSQIGFFDQLDDPDILAQQDYFERQSDAVDAPLSVQGETEGQLTVNNIAINEGTVTVFYTAESPDLLPEDPVSLRALTPITSVCIDGGEKSVSHPGGYNDTVRRTGERTMAFMESYYMGEADVPATCTLTVSAEEIFGKKTDWSMDFAVDMRELLADTRFAISGQKVHLEGMRDETKPPPYWTHDVVITEVRIGKNGGVAILHEETPEDIEIMMEQEREWQRALTAAIAETKGGYDKMTNEERWSWYAAFEKANPRKGPALGYDVPDFSPFVDFAILNDKGESLNARCDGITGGVGVSENRLYFQADYETKSLTFLPILGSGEHVEKELRFDQVGTPIQMYDGLSVTLVEVIKDQAKNEITLRYKEEGVQSIWRYGVSRFTGKDGQPYSDTGSTSSPEAPFRDNVTNVITTTVTFLDGCDLDQLYGVLFAFDVPNIAYDQAVTVYFP